jgi:hypothetical protein
MLGVRDVKGASEEGLASPAAPASGGVDRGAAVEQA